jgi:methyl-accepting chemotaxis protein
MQTTKPICNDFTLWFQIKYCLVMFASLATTTLLIYLYFKDGLGESYVEALTTLNQVEDALPGALLVTFLVQSLVIFFFSIAINLFVSHKIAGPIYRFEHTLRSIDAGDLQPVARIRDGDQIKSIVSALNRLIASLRNKYTSLQGVEQELNQVIRQQENGGNPDLRELCQSIVHVRVQLGSSNDRRVDE